MTISNLEFYSFDRSIPTGYTYAVWCDPPGPALFDLPGRDTDGDGMPNAWERLHGLSENDPGDADADADGDGMSNRAEYLADTDPLSAASRLELTSCERQGNGILLKWQGGLSVTQYFELAQTPGGPWVPVGTNSPPMAPAGVMTARVDGVASGFLRIKVGQ